MSDIEAIRAYVQRVVTDDDRALLDECRAARPTDQPVDVSHARTWALWTDRVGGRVVSCLNTCDATITVDREGRGRVRARHRHRPGGVPMTWHPTRLVDLDRPWPVAALCALPSALAGLARDLWRRLVVEVCGDPEVRQ